MNGNGVIKVFLGGTHFQCDREALQHFIHPETNTVNTDNLLFRSDANQLHAARLAVGGNSGIHRGKRGFIHFHLVIAVLFASLLLGQAYGTNRRVAENHGRDIAVIQMLIRLVVKQTLGQATACSDGNWRQLNGTGVIADGINSRNTGVLVFIHDDVAFFVGFHASNRQVEVVGGRFTTDRPNQAIYCFATTIFQLQSQAAVSVFNNRFRDCVRMQGRAFGVHHLNQRVDDHRIEAAQRRVFTHKQMRLGAQAVNHARQLNGDVTCADDRNAFRQRGQLKEAIGVDPVFHTRNARMARATTGGDQNMIGSNGFTVYFNGFGIHKTGKAFNHIDVIFTQHVVV